MQSNKISQKTHKLKKDEEENEEELHSEVKKKSSTRPTKTSAEYWKTMQSKWSADSVRIMNELSKQNELLESLFRLVKKGQEEQLKAQQDLIKTIKQLYHNPANDHWWEKSVFKAINLLVHENKYPTEQDLQTVVEETVAEYLPQKNLTFTAFWSAIRNEVFHFI